MTNIPQAVGRFWAQLNGGQGGISHLLALDKIIIKQEVEMLEVLTGFETKNRYAILNEQGQQVYAAFEESDTCARLMCKNQRGFSMHVLDQTNTEVIKYTRPFVCCGGPNICAGCAPHSINSEFPLGQVTGTVKQAYSCCKPNFDILDANGETVLKMTGPICPCQAVCCTDDISYPVLLPDGVTQVGRVAKVWGGCVVETYTKASTFTVEFPKDLDVKIKAALIGAAFLLDFIFFERQN